MPSPVAQGFVGAARPMAASDVAAAAFALGCVPAIVAAVIDVESSGSGYDARRRPKILFEPHVFYRELQGRPVMLASAVKAGLAYERQGEQPYPPTSDANYVRLSRACLLDPTAAMHAASWGVAQVMGYNFEIGGYADVAAMVQACMDSESAQFGLLVGFVTKHGLAAALRTRDFVAFARGYNGPGAVAAYACHLQQAYNRHARGVMFAASVSPVQPAPAAHAEASQITSVFGAMHAALVTSGISTLCSADSLMDAEWLKIRSGTLA